MTTRLQRALLMLTLVLALVHLQGLGLGFSGHEMAASLDSSAPFTKLLFLKLTAEPASPLLLRILGLMVTILAVLASGFAINQLLGAGQKNPVGMVLTGLLLLSPFLWQVGLDIGSFILVLGLAAGAGGTGWLLLGSGPLHRLGALGCVAFAGWSLGWPASAVIVASIGLPHRNRSSPRSMWFSAGITSGIGAFFHTPRVVTLWPQLHPELAGFGLPESLLLSLLAAPLIAGFFLLRERRLSILILTTAASISVMYAARSSTNVALTTGLLLATCTLALALEGLTAASIFWPKRVLGAALWVLSIGSLGLWGLDFERSRSSVDTWRLRSLSRIQTTVDQIARDKLDCQVFVLAPPAFIGGFSGFPPELALGLAPPFAPSSIEVDIARDRAELIAKLVQRREQGERLDHSILVFGQEPTLTKMLAPIVQLGPLRAGFRANFDDADLEAKLLGPGDWAFARPIPAHMIGAINLTVPRDGLSGQLTLEFGSQAKDDQHRLSMEISLPRSLAGSSRERLELALPATFEQVLGPPLTAIRFTGTVATPGLDPKIRLQTTRPSLIQPAPTSLINLSPSAPPPALHVYFDPKLVRPTHFTLELDLVAADGTLRLQASGTVPAGIGADLFILPSRLGPRDPSLAAARGTWANFLSHGLNQALKRSKGEASATIWVTFQGPGGIQLGSTAKQQHSFLATLP